MISLRMRRTSFISVAAIAGLALAMLPQASAAAAVPPANGAHSFVTIMTRNMDEGTDFGYITAAAAGQMDLATAVSLTYNEVVASDVCGRAARIADEIAAAQPDLVSIQEAAVWTGPVPVNCPGAATPTTIDAEAALMHRLAADGASYRVAQSLDEFNSSVVQLPFGLSFLDRDLLLARNEPENQLALVGVTAHHFSTLLPLPLGGGLTVTIFRGWISADVTVRGRTARVIATHLESFYEPVQEAQAAELVAGPAATSLPVILAGDLNTGPGSAQIASYNFLTSTAGFIDTWAVTHPGEAGYTDGFYKEDPLRPSVPSERIDLVLVRGTNVPFGPKDYLVGTEAPQPSDHAGVVAKVTIE